MKSHNQNHNQNHSGLIRTLLAFTQAIIDIILYRLSFALIIYLYFSQKNMPDFTFEVRAFFTGTVLAVFYFNSLYDFKNWIVWDELKAILKSAVLALMVMALYLYSQRFEISRFMISASIVIFVPLCLLARYIFRSFICGWDSLYKYYNSRSWQNRRNFC